MAEYNLSPGLWNGCFLVPAELVDKHLKLAPPNAIRALLYILRNGISRPDAADVASALGVDLPCAEDAIDYWVQDELIERTAYSETPVKENVINITADTSDTLSLAAAEASPAVVVKIGTMPSYSRQQVNIIMQEHPELRRAFSVAEEVYRHPLSDATVNLVVGLIDWYGMSVDAIVEIMHRSEATDRLRPADIKALAEDFYMHGAVTKETAQAYVLELGSIDNVINETSKALNIADHTLYAKERKAFETWRCEFGYGTDMVLLALDVAMRNTDSTGYSPSLLSYMQKVLKNWHSAGIASCEQAMQAMSDAISPKAEKTSSGQKHKPTGSVSYNLKYEEELAMQRFSGKDDA